VLIGEDESLPVHEKARAVPGFAPHGHHGVLQALELFGKVIGGRFCRRCGSSGFLHLGVVIGQVNVLLGAGKRYLNIPRKAPTSSSAGFGDETVQRPGGSCASAVPSKLDSPPRPWRRT